jgi:hypothetical protein
MNKKITKASDRILVILCACVLVLTPVKATTTAGLLPVNLRSDYYANPLGIDSPQPRLDWILQANDSAARGLTQSAYQILVASTPMSLLQDKGDLWDSGKIMSDQMNQIIYAGQPLKSDEAVWWKVRVWNGAGNVSTWSAPAQWTMGVLNQSDWEAKWIKAPASLAGDDNSTFLLRYEFPVKVGLKRGTVSICGLGQYEMYLNGDNVTADVLTPGWTEYNKTCVYDTYDVTSLIHEGPNAIGILLGNGMYRVAKGGRYAKFQKSFGPLQAIARIRLEYDDGSTTIIGTDERWHTGTSPMTFSSVYGGEDWDARMEQKGWDRAGFDETKWLPAEESNGPGGKLRGISRSAPPIRTFETQTAVSHHKINQDVTIYDLGQAAAHLTRFTVHGPAGSMVKVTPGELLNLDGSLFNNNYNGKAWSVYTLAGTGNETYTSKFYYCGDRYLQVECIPFKGGGDPPMVDSIAGLVVHSSVTPAGEFSCSNDLFNRTYAMIHWAELSNMMSVITDCPHRERLGWLEQDHLHGPSFFYNYDIYSLFGKVIGDISDCQLPNGLIPTHVPEYPIFSAKWRDAIEWGSTGVLLPWQQYERTGDVGVLRRNYAVMKGYVEHITQNAQGGIASAGLGDWTGLRASTETPFTLISTAIYYEDMEVLAKTAKLLGYPDAAATDEQLAEKIRVAFNQAFFHAETNQYGTGSQCANALALDLGLVEAASRAAVLKNLVGDLERRKYVLTVGEVGLPYLLRALATAGRSDVIFAVNNQTECPGYGYQLKMGATALPETWNANRDNSQIQFMLGHVVEWYFHDLAGIQLDSQSPGYKHFIIHPSIVGDLTNVKSAYVSPRGTIVSEWKQDGPHLTMHVVIPPNSTATICVPTTNAESITQNGTPIAEVTVLKSLKTGDPCTEYEAGSGDYTVAALLP